MSLMSCMEESWRRATYKAKATVAQSPAAIEVGRSRRSERQVREREPALGDDEVDEAKDHGGDARRDQRLSPDLRIDRRPRLVALRNILTRLMRVAHADRKHGEENRPPHDEIDRDGARQFHAS